MVYQRSIEDIAETLQNAKARQKCCTLLIGAGCSVKAGIPTADGFVKVIQQRYPRAYKRAQDKTYPKCMAELLLSERRDLIAEHVDAAKINWAHICIALLMQAGYVDRVLTTNFDPLVSRACALLGEFPAIYDFAASQLFKAADIPDKAVFYLHGQRTGFVLINTDEDFREHANLLRPVFEDAGLGRVWIVVGYSGESDPVFEQLAGVPRFDNGLFWVGYLGNEPAQHVRDKLLSQNKDAFYTNGCDADSFFVGLTQRLNLFPPGFIARHFSHLDRTLEVLTPYTLPGQTSEADVIHAPRQWIRNAIAQFETQQLQGDAGKDVTASEARGLAASPLVEAQRLLMAGDYSGVLTFLEHYDVVISPELADPLSWAYVMLGNTLGEQAKTKSGAEAGQLFAEAGQKYQAALAIKPDMDEALNNWGNTLGEQAKTKSGAEAGQLFAEAGQKYQAALAIKPDMDEALNNWGNTLGEQAKTKSGAEADQLFAEARKVLCRAEDIKPGSGAYNLACLHALQGDEAGCRQWLEKRQNLVLCLVVNTCWTIQTCKVFENKNGLSSLLLKYKQHK